MLKQNANKGGRKTKQQRKQSCMYVKLSEVRNDKAEVRTKGMEKGKWEG